MNFIEFCKGMKKHFGITNGVNKFVSRIFVVAPETGIMDIIKFDAWLHKKHGEYEERGMSMANLVETEYGAITSKFVKEALGLND